MIDGGAGADTMSGGDGNDTYVIDQSGDVVIEAAGATNSSIFDTIRSSISLALPANVERLVLIGDAAIDGTGSAAGFEVITGNDAANILFGGGGQGDSLYGAGGADTLDLRVFGNYLNLSAGYGGAGDDLYLLDSEFSTAVEAAGEGNDTVRMSGSMAFDLAANVENLFLLTGQVALGNAVANRIVGNSADNFLDGRGGADTLEGGAGNDNYRVDNAGDLIIELADEGADTVVVEQPYVVAGFETPGAPMLFFLPGGGTISIPGPPVWTPAAFAGLSYSIANTNIETLYLQTSSNTFHAGIPDADATGNALANSMRGTEGRNVFDGGAGADTMTGYGGDDTYFVDNAGDLVEESPGAGNDSVFASVSHALSANVETLTLTGNLAASAIGNSLANRITGNGAANLLVR